MGYYDQPEANHFIAEFDCEECDYTTETDAYYDDFEETVYLECDKCKAENKVTTPAGYVPCYCGDHCRC